MAATMSPPLPLDGRPPQEVLLEAIRRIRAARVVPTAEAVLPVAVALPPAHPRLQECLRGYDLVGLRIEILRAALEAAASRDHVEGLAAGRHYGDPALMGLLPADFAVRFLPEAAARAERLGAVADLLLHLIGREAALEAALTEGAGV